MISTQVPLIITGSARRNSDTEKFVEKLFNNTALEKVNLLDYLIAPYNYNGTYPSSDNFEIIINKMLLHKNVVFATPVYWYSMSGLFKCFLDRFTDLITIKKTTGRQLKNLSISLIAVGADPILPEGFDVPFALTCKYFDMIYKGNIYFSTKDDSLVSVDHDKIAEFLGQIASDSI